MAINATNSSTPRELIPAGNYIARCYQMLHIGTNLETIDGKTQLMNKVRIGWELPTEMKVFDEAKGEQPLVISQEYTLSMNEKANLRKMLSSWRGKDFTEEQAKSFDITNLIGVPCMLNIIHKPSKTGDKTYQNIGSVSPMPKGVPCPAQINPKQILQYDDFDTRLFDSLPDFIKNRVITSVEYKAMTIPHSNEMDNNSQDNNDDLPF